MRLRARAWSRAAWCFFEGRSQRPPSTFAEEVDWAVDVEGARTLEDVIYRRLRAAWFLPDELEQAVDRVAARMAGKLGWDAATTDAEIRAVQSRLADELAFRPHP